MLSANRATEVDIFHRDKVRSGDGGGGGWGRGENREKVPTLSPQMSSGIPAPLGYRLPLASCDKTLGILPTLVTVS